MTRITIRPAWTFVADSGDKVDPLLFELLAALHEDGKLTLAAQRVRLSYRYAWELLERWHRFFGAPLVRKARGKGASLTPLGEKLLWAAQRTDASLFTRLENIASDLNVELTRALRESQAVLHIHASHGYAVEKLPELMRRHGNATVDLQYMGSAAALASLERGACDLAGFHVPIGELAPALWQEYSRFLKPARHVVVRLVTRTQGLMMARHNPLGIASLRDLTRTTVRFVNRQPGSGTRILFDALLEQARIDPAQVRGYDNVEFTHAAVGAFVASGAADAAFGVEPAARQFRLAFVPLIQERYMLACRADAPRREPVRELIALVGGADYRAMMESVPGYALDEPGTVHKVNLAMAGFGEGIPKRAARRRAA